MNTRRTERMASVLGRRLGHVRCAIEGLYHAHNIAAVLRTCDALGVHHAHLVQGHFQPGRKAARGAERWLDIHLHEDADAAIAELRAAGCSVWVADLDEHALPPEEVPLDRPVCLWFGAELVGVSEAARAAADGVVCIPMRGFSQSLNVSVAAAMALRPVAERARATIGEAALLPVEERAAVWDAWMERERAMRRGIARRVDPTRE